LNHRYDHYGLVPLIDGKIAVEQICVRCRRKRVILEINKNGQAIEKFRSFKNWLGGAICLGGLGNTSEGNHGGAQNRFKPIKLERRSTN